MRGAPETDARLAVFSRLTQLRDPVAGLATAKMLLDKQ